MNRSASSLAVMLTLLLAGCASHAPPKVDETRVRQFAGRGYVTDDHFSITTTFASWRIGESAFDIALTTPTPGNNLPVVIYLPGLGESRTSGEDWRTAWAQAGYAVLSVQLLDDDQKAWSSAAARRGDFSGAARERYAGLAATARLKALATLLGELQKRQAGDDALLRRLDLSHVAIAGFDIGAYAAMLAAGETPKGNAETPRLPISIAAIIALSPYADFSGSALSTRYQSIALPVLSISGDADSDAAGVVASPSVRKAPFEYMPSKDAYLLWLGNANHAVFSGTALATSVEKLGEKFGEASGDAGGGQGAGQGSHKSGSRRGGRGGDKGDSGMAGSGGNSSGANDRIGGGRPESATSPTDRAMDVSLVQGVTTAFLDSYLKQDSIAQEWLRKDARRWIGARGELKRK